jgi:large subunit ribosomal protein L3
MKFLLGKKLDMTQVWQGDKVAAVTRVEAGPCAVTQVKNKDKDGYIAVQVGFGEKKEKNIAKPQLGHLKKCQMSNAECRINFRYLKEFRVDNSSDLKIGDVIDVGAFQAGDKIDVIGISKGKGFQGVVKRHGFHGHNSTHGTKDQVRMPGSISASGVQRVFKGLRMGGRMGGERVTIKNSEIIEIDKENNILLVKGAVPGARNGLVMIAGEGDLVLKKPTYAKVSAGEQESKEITKQDEVRVNNIVAQVEEVKDEQEINKDEVKISNS